MLFEELLPSFPAALLVTTRTERTGHVEILT